MRSGTWQLPASQMVVRRTSCTHRGSFRGLELGPGRLLSHPDPVLLGLSEVEAGSRSRRRPEGAMPRSSASLASVFVTRRRSEASEGNRCAKIPPGAASQERQGINPAKAATGRLDPHRDHRARTRSRGLKRTDSVNQLIENRVRSEFVLDTSHEIATAVRSLEHVPTEREAGGFGASIQERRPFSAGDRP